MDILIKTEKLKNKNLFTITPIAPEHIGKEYEIILHVLLNGTNYKPVALFRGQLEENTVLTYKSEPISHFSAFGNTFCGFEVHMNIGTEELKKKIIT